jgi:ATP-binding protein involved in chromosome partitioning
MHNEKASIEDQKITQMLTHVKNKLLVFSGKGGVGKSTVAANLALALSQKGLKVGLLDVDLHGPNLAKMLGVDNCRIEITDQRMIPVPINENLKLISMAFFLESTDTPVIWRGPLKMKAIKQFLADVEWGELDWLICDSPPGTGDEPLSVADLLPGAAAIIVTTPQEVSLLDSRKAASFAQLLKMNILGVVENMSGFLCPHCGKEIALFSAGGGEKIAQEYNIPLLGQIPIDPRIVELGDKGQLSILQQEETETARIFAAIADKIIK